MKESTQRILRPENKMPTIGVLLGRINAYTTQIWSGISDIAQEKQVNLLTFISEDVGLQSGTKSTGQLIHQMVHENSLDGLIILSSSLGFQLTYEELTSFCHGFSRLPTISVGEIIQGIQSIDIDNRQGMWELLHHLRDEHGYQRYAFLQGPPGNTGIRERFEVYQEFLIEQGIPYDPNLVIAAQADWWFNQTAVEEFIHREFACGVVITYNDIAAINLLQQFNRYGIQVPGDIAVVGYDNLFDSEYTIPPLTTVHQPVSELGSRSLEMILSLLEGEELPEEVILPTRLQLRQSCGCPSPLVKLVPQRPPSNVQFADDAVTFLIDKKSEIRSNFEQAVAEIAPQDGVIVADALKLFDAFWDEVLSEKPNLFLDTFNTIIRKLPDQKLDTQIWQNILSILRGQILPYLHSNELVSCSEDLWHQARVSLGEISQQNQFQRGIQIQEKVFTLSRINENLISTFDLTLLKDTFFNALQQLNISHGFLCLKDIHSEGDLAPGVLPPWSHLIFAYFDGEIIEIEPGGVCFSTKDILPEAILPTDKPYDLVIFPLQFQKSYLGHLMLETKAWDSCIYDFLRIQISSAVQGTSLIRQLSDAQTNLEDKVDERTIELQNEITERVRAEEIIRTNEKRYRALFEKTSDAVFILSLDATHLAVNQQAADMLGYSVDEMIGMHANKVVAPDEFDNAMNRFEAIKQGESIPIYERNLIRKDGSKLPVEINIAMVSDDAGNPLHIQSIIRDIANRKQSERVLNALNQASLAMRQVITPEEIFETVGNELKTLGFGCTIFRTNHDLSQIYPQYFNYEGKVISALEKMLNIQAEEFSISIESVEIFQRTIWERETIFSNVTESISQVFPRHFKSVVKQLVSMLKVPRAINAPLVVEDQLMGMLSVQSTDLTTEEIPAVTAFALQVAAAWQKARLLQDLEQSLTEKTRMEDSLRENEEKYRTLFELSPQGIVLIGLNGIILDANQAAAGIVNRKLEDTIGKSFLELGLLEEDQLPAYLDIFARAISGEFIDSIEIKFLAREDEIRWLKAHPALLKIGEEVLALQLIVEDITERKRAEQSIQHRMAELEAIHQTSTKLANASLQVDEIARIAVQELGSAMNVDKCSFALLEAKDRKLNLIADLWLEEGKKEFLNQENTIWLDNYPATAKVLETMVPVVIQAYDIETYPAEVASIQINETATLAIIPLAVKSHAIGIMKLETLKERIYTSSQLNLAKTLANQIAVALDNARLFESAQKELLEREQTEIALQESEEKFRGIFENAVMGLYRSTPGGDIVMANPALIRMMGYASFDELAQRDLNVSGYVSDFPRDEFISRIERDGQVVGFSAAWSRKDGSILFVQENARAIYDESGQIIYFEGTVEDITDRKRIEQERQSLIEFQRIVAMLSARFINLSILEIEDEIKHALSIVAEYAQADASSVWMFSEDQFAASKTYGWPTNIQDPGNQGVPISRYPWLFGTLLDNQSVVISTISDIPENDDDMFGLMSDMGMLSILAVPLVSEGDVIGSLSIYMLKIEKKWASDLEALLKIIGDIIVNALERKRAEENIRKLTEELELRVIQRTQQLEAANKELEAFSYSVSHDLRAPLRAIDGFSLALVEDYGNKLDGNAKNYLSRVRAASQRMGYLIDDLLKLSRVTRGEMAHHEVDLSELVREALTELQETEPDREVSFDIHPNLIVLGDKHLLQIMLVNLCTNAWKFTRKREQTCIEFGCFDEENPKVFFIRDNGIGFEMAYADKLFGTFQRLHTTQEFEGTGIGLATVKRIILRHGGSVWAEGVVGKGAIFYFTIGDTP